MTIDTRIALSEADDHGPCPVTLETSLGGRLAAASRAAQGRPATVDDAAVLARLGDLCAAPRPPQTGRCV